jgi:aspartyl-tRNA(Asn)/glutamyl-tRNA(Gln) amidotransferase subunit C
MKDLSTDNVKHVAALARLEIPSGDEAAFVKHMNNVLKYVELLNEVDTKDVAPLFSPVREHLEFYSEDFNTHVDEVRPSLDAESVLKNAPSKHQNQFAVEAVIEEN